MKGTSILTPGCKTVLEFLQENEREYWVGVDIAAKLGVKGIYSMLNSLIKKGYVINGDVEEREIIEKNGKRSVYPYVTYKLTQKGRDANVETL